jgi:hypothetical protein
MLLVGFVIALTMQASSPRHARSRVICQMTFGTTQTVRSYLQSFRALDVIEETNKPCFSVAGKEYNKKACCEVGQNVTSDSCPAGSPGPSALIIVITVLASIIGVLMMGLILLYKLKKPNPMVDVPVAAVPVQEGDISIINPSKNANMEQYPGASAPPPPVNPQFLAQEGVRVY